MDSSVNRPVRRNTRPKSLILQCLSDLDGRHITAEELLSTLQKQNTPVSKSTAYRFLSQLEKDGLIKKYFVSENTCACYQFIGKNSRCNEHFHFMCRDCGNIMHFENLALQKLIKKIGAANGFSIDIKESPFYGLCEKCQNKNRKEKAK